MTSKICTIREIQPQQYRAKQPWKDNPSDPQQPRETPMDRGEIPMECRRGESTMVSMRTQQTRETPETEERSPWSTEEESSPWNPGECP